MLEYDRHAFPVAQRKPRGSEIQQATLAPGRDIDVVRAYVPMQEIERVYLDKRLHDGFEYGKRLHIRDLAALVCQVILEAHPVYVLHHEVGGVVLFEIVLHRNDIRRVLQLCKYLSLFQKVLHALTVVILRPSGERNVVAIRISRGN